MTIDAQACARQLCGMLRFPTISYSDESSMDFQQFYAMQQYMEETYPLIHKHFQRERVGKAGLLYHLCGDGTGAEPLLLMAHQDIVSAGELSQWTYPPFSGTAAGGYVWGRGAIDCKGHIVAQLAGLEALLRDGFHPHFDIYLFYGYNEEVMSASESSSAAIASRMMQKRGLRFGGIVDEGGGMKIGTDVGVPEGLCTVVVAEKGYADFEISCRCPGGHSSKPYKNGALAKIASAILALEENPIPYRLTETVKKRYQILAPYIQKDRPALGCLLTDMEKNWDALQPYIDQDPEMAAMLHTTMVPTVAQAAKQPNILPERASVIVNCRLMEGDTLRSIEEHIRAVIPDGMEVTLLRGNEATPFSQYESPLKQVLVETCREQYGDGIVEIPDVLLAGTDAKHMYPLSDHVYRFSPFFKRTVIPAAHSVNECLGIDTLVEGAVFYCRALARYNEL